MQLKPSRCKDFYSVRYCRSLCRKSFLSKCRTVSKTTLLIRMTELLPIRIKSAITNSNFSYSDTYQAGWCCTNLLGLTHWSSTHFHKHSSLLPIGSCTKKHSENYMAQTWGKPKNSVFNKANQINIIKQISYLSFLSSHVVIAKLLLKLDEVILLWVCLQCKFNLAQRWLFWPDLPTIHMINPQVQCWKVNCSSSS